MTNTLEPTWRVAERMGALLPTWRNKVAPKQFLIADAPQLHVMLGYAMRKADCEYYFARRIGEAPPAYQSPLAMKIVKALA